MPPWPGSCLKSLTKGKRRERVTDAGRVGLWPSPLSLEVQGARPRHRYDSREGRACRKHKPAPRQPPWGTPVLAAQKATACSREGDNDFLEDGAVARILVSFVKQKQLCYVLPERRQPHNSLSLMEKKVQSKLGSVFSQRKTQQKSL